MVPGLSSLAVSLAGMPLPREAAPGASHYTSCPLPVPPAPGTGGNHISRQVRSGSGEGWPSVGLADGASLDQGGINPGCAAFPSTGPRGDQHHPTHAGSPAGTLCHGPRVPRLAGWLSPALLSANSYWQHLRPTHLPAPAMACPMAPNPEPLWSPAWRWGTQSLAASSENSQGTTAAWLTKQ